MIMRPFGVVFCIIFHVKFNFISAILGGHDISIDKVPHQVNYGDVCGGVLIHKKWALTTAHCGTNHNFIRVGSKYRLKAPKVQIKAHLVHPKYGIKHKYDYDIQLLELKRSLAFGKTVAAIPLCEADCGEHFLMTGWGYPVERVARGGNAIICCEANQSQTLWYQWISGKRVEFNSTSPLTNYCEASLVGDYKEILQQVEVSLVPFDRCQAVDQFWYNHTLTPRMFCAGDQLRDACQGDSGGGAVSRAQLAGLSSFGLGCGRVPGVYIHTSHPRIRTWIRHYTGL